MAENEYLDSSKARRWQSVVQAIRDGCSIDEVANRVEECFFKTLRHIDEAGDTYQFFRRRPLR